MDKNELLEGIAVALNRIDDKLEELVITLRVLNEILENK
jgi:hypothetical protein